MHRTFSRLAVAAAGAALLLAPSVLAGEADVVRRQVDVRRLSVDLPGSTVAPIFGEPQQLVVRRLGGTTNGLLTVHFIGADGETIAIGPLGLGESREVEVGPARIVEVAHGEEGLRFTTESESLLIPLDDTEVTLDGRLEGYGIAEADYDVDKERMAAGRVPAELATELAAIVLETLPIEDPDFEVHEDDIAALRGIGTDGLVHPYLGRPGVTWISDFRNLDVLADLEPEARGRVAEVLADVFDVQPPSQRLAVVVEREL